MKICIQLLLIQFWSVVCLAQPTRNETIYLEVFDFENSNSTSLFLDKKIIGSKTKIHSKGMHLIDVSEHTRGFIRNREDLYVNKTFINPTNKFMLVNQDDDTMKVTLLNSYFSSYIKIPFKKGAFTVNLKGVDISVLPHKIVKKNQLAVPDITPKQWIEQENRTVVKIDEIPIKSSLNSSQKEEKIQNTVLYNFSILTSLTNQEFTYSLEYMETFIEDSLAQTNKKESLPIRAFKMYIRIKENKYNSLVFLQQIQETRIEPTKKDFKFELLEINFDTIDDVKITFKNNIIYIISYKNDEEKNLFYLENFLKNCKEFNRNELEMKLTFEEPSYRMDYRETFEFLGIRYDSNYYSDHE